MKFANRLKKEERRGADLAGQAWIILSSILWIHKKGVSIDWQLLPMR